MRVACLVAFLFAAPCSAADPAEKPNVVFILADDRE